MSQQHELIPMEVGEYLKNKRLERRLDLDAVATAVRLDKDVLTAIEADGAIRLAPVYRKGYIRQYAEYLRVPPDEIRRMLSAQEQAEPQLRTVFAGPPKRSLADNWLRATSYVLASLLIGTLAWQFTHEAVRLSQKGSRLHGGQEVAIGGPNSTTDRIQALDRPVNASITQFDPLQESATEPASVGDSATGSELQVSVSADSWVEITDADGRELEMDLLRGGSEKSYQGRQPFRILFGRASAVRLSVDGKAVDLAPFTNAGVVQMTWPQAADTGAAAD